MMKAFICSAASISAQNTLVDSGFLIDIIEYNTNRLRAIEPDYKEYVDPKLIRRMSHVIKMGVATATKCLKQAGLDMPDAIITGSAYGIMEDTVTFLTRIVELNEEMLPPTAFIQSTHNTVAAQIALMLKCHSYNNTFVHKGISFESALLDSLMLLHEGEATNVLTGGIDEMSDTGFTVLSRLGLFKRKPINNLDLFKESSKGSLSGEGASFFVLSQQANEANLAELTGLKTIYKKDTTFDITESIQQFLAEHRLSVADIDLVITGKNGDVNNDAPYENLKAGIFSKTTCANYKHLCGEYPTSSSFALWLAANILHHQQVPSVLLEQDITIAVLKRILIYNRYQNRYHSLMLVSSCKMT